MFRSPKARSRSGSLPQLALFLAALAAPDHAIAQSQPKPGGSQQESQQLEPTDKWRKIWPHLFGEAFTDGAVCSSALLKGTFCRMRRGDFPGLLQFYTAPPEVSHELEYFDLRMEPTKWVVHVKREGSATPPRHGVPGTLAVAKWPLAETLLTRIGFTRARLASCGLKPQTFAEPPLGYSCQSFDLGGIQKFAFRFVVQITPDAGADICPRHPLCSEHPAPSR